MVAEKQRKESTKIKISGLVKLHKIWIRVRVRVGKLALALGKGKGGGAGSLRFCASVQPMEPW